MKYLYVTTISMTLDYFLKGVMTDLKTTDKLTCSCTTDIIAEGQGITKKEVRVLGHGNIRGRFEEGYVRANLFGFYSELKK